MKNLPEKLQNNLPAPTPSYTNIADGYQAALKVVDDVILKNYVSELSSMEIVPLSKSVLESNIRDNVRFFKITEMVYEKDELATYKFASVFNALSITDSAVFIIIDSDGVKTDFYMGVRSLDEYRTISSLKNTVENAMKGQFPGIKTFDDYTVEDMESILNRIKAKSISAVSCVANNKAHEQTSNQSFVQGLEKLVLSMQGEKYTGIIIANGTSQAQLRELRKGYENVYTQLSAFATTQVNYTSNNSFNYSVAETNGNSHAKTHTDNRYETQTENKTQGSSTSHSISKESVAGKTIKGVASAASLLGAALAPVTGGVSLAVGGVVSGGLGMLGSAISKNVSDSISSNESISQSFSSVKGFSDGTTDTVNYGISKTEGYTKGISEGMTLTLHDKSIEDTLERINKQLKRIDEFESLGMYECAAYFLSDDQYAAEVAASTYKALMRGENSGVEIAAINSWGQFQSEKTAMLAQYVKNFIHPVFKYNGPAGNIEVTPCSLVSGNELAIHMGLPRRSVCGLPVIEHADFGKEIVTYDGAKGTTGINLGKIFNMGSSGNSKVSLNVNSLSMHTFVTGSTGSGKSNTVYEIIRQLDNFGVNYMVIEPAKGEYKNVFGMRPNVQVYGTNPQYTNLLRINPFKFPKGIHILEHIDRLIEIFNVCWPMYAAMPAVLKDAVLQAYESCGWNLAESQNRYSNDLFPTFADLLNELVAVIQSSAYSEEVKSNYTGSLVTRIKSLTNGLNGQIFAANEINNSELFDKKVIVDISRVGSTETKSLIMGILIMRLSEHRMSFSEEMNSPLRHITVLEEAHNILKRTSTEQNPESSNVASKSVEMISNAIAEMRTYGEGFIIADQSPSAVDISAIRNTNTKIIMRLPDEQDRRLAGKSAGLKDDQLDEITKLPKGVAVVYQNDWLEPVLCKIEKFKGEEHPYKKTATILFSSSGEQKKTLIQNLLRKNAGEQLDMTIGELTDMMVGMDIPTNIKMKAIKALRINGTCSLKDISPIIYDLVCNSSTEKESENVDSIEEWRNVFVYAQDSLLADLDTLKQNKAIECILREQIERYEKPAEYLNTWNEFLKKEVM
jgi:hypothetical protein